MGKVAYVIINAKYRINHAVQVIVDRHRLCRLFFSPRDESSIRSAMDIEVFYSISRPRVIDDHEHAA